MVKELGLIFWVQLDTCNYRCSYCFFPAERLGFLMRLEVVAAFWNSLEHSPGDDRLPIEQARVYDTRRHNCTHKLFQEIT